MDVCDFYPPLTLAELRRRWMTPAQLAEVALSDPDEEKSPFLRRVAIWSHRGYLEPEKSGTGKTAARLYCYFDALTARIMDELTAGCGMAAAATHAAATLAVRHVERLIEEGRDPYDFDSDHAPITIARLSFDGKRIECRFPSPADLIKRKEALPTSCVYFDLSNFVWQTHEAYVMVWRAARDANLTVEDLNRLYPNRGADEFGNPLDPDHPWNRGRRERRP